MNPLFSSFITLYTLILLYFPSFFLNLLFSPVFVSSIVLLFSLLRFAASQQANRHPEKQISDPHPDPSCRRSFLQWDVGAPLEVIHEGSGEGEDAADDVVFSLQRYPSLSRYYPETDSDSDFDSDSDSNTSMEKSCFPWGGEEIDQEKDGLIEIQLHPNCAKRKVLEEIFDFQIEEDNFIEIDISPLPAAAGR